MDDLLHRITCYNRSLSKLSPTGFSVAPCFGESYQLFADIVTVFLSSEEVNQQSCDAVEDFKQLQFQCFTLINAQTTVSRYGQSNSLNFLVVFLYFSLFDKRYGGIAVADKEKYKNALQAYLRISQMKSLNKYDKLITQDFNNKHLKLVMRALE